MTIGLGFGDEGKGSFIYYLSNKYKQCKYFVKYNGGCQAKHTVRHNGVDFSFAQLSPSMLMNNTFTVLNKNYIMNSINLLVECECFVNTFCKDKRIQDILDRVYIDNKCVCVTPIHKLYNRIEEKNDGTRGSVGIGVSIAGLWEIEDGVLYAEDLKNLDITKNVKNLKHILQVQKEYAISQCKEKNFPYDEIEDFDIWGYIRNLVENMRYFKFNIVNVNDIISSKKCIYESSQGLLLDKKKGIYPNTTLTDTSMNSLEDIEGERIGFIRTIYTRHGQGVFPTESEDLKNYCVGDIQEIGEFNGSIRTGYFDMVLFKYAVNDTKVQSVYMSYLDILDKLKEIKICVGYDYVGTVTKEMEELFEITKTMKGCFVTGIKKMSKDVGFYLQGFTPTYLLLHFNSVDLEDKIHLYVSEIERLSGVKIAVISKGADLEDKEEKE